MMKFMIWQATRTGIILRIAEGQTHIDAVKAAGLFHESMTIEMNMLELITGETTAVVNVGDHSVCPLKDAHWVFGPDLLDWMREGNEEDETITAYTVSASE